MPKSSLAVLAKSRLANRPALIALFSDHCASEILNSGSFAWANASLGKTPAAAIAADVARKLRRKWRGMFWSYRSWHLCKTDSEQEATEKTEGRRIILVVGISL